MLVFIAEVCLNLMAGGFIVTPDQVFQHFGGRSQTAKALKVKYQAVAQWADKGKVPKGRQFEIELLTGGLLKADIVAAPEAA
jgi:hypothetical protein